MIVYVMEAGCYEQQSVVGVFSSVENAMASWKPSSPEYATSRREFALPQGEQRKPYIWTWSGPDDGGRYHYGAPGALCIYGASITPYEVDE